MLSTKFNTLIDRLSQKIRLSANQVPGFIIGLSGTDSLATFILLYNAMKQHNMQHRLYGIHYVNNLRKKPTWFERDIIPWMRDEFPETRIEVHTPLGGNQDQQRWADLHFRALNKIEVNGYGDLRFTSLDAGENYWVSGCMNATEKALGNYSILSNSVSMQPIQTIYKSEILDICKEHNVPDIAIEMSQIPDCLCGRDELAAANVRLIDDIITFKLDPAAHDPAILAEVYAWVQETKRQNDFKNRTPFNV